MVLCLAISESDAQKDGELQSQLQDFRHAAELLSARAEEGTFTVLSCHVHLYCSVFV